MIQRTLNIAFAVIILALAGILVSMNCSKQRTAYIEIGKVYNEFQFTKELEAKLQNTQQMRKQILDSLEVELKSLSQMLETGAPSKEEIRHFEQERQKYLDKAQLFEKENQSQVSQYMQQVMKQLNQYVQDYGKEEGYTYILGAEGSGILMYAEQENNITGEVIRYITQKHQEKK